MSAAQTSIDAYYGFVQDKKQRQYDMILSAMEVGKDYSFRELADITGLLPSTLSARINELRDKHKVVERAPRRLCTHTHIHIIPHRIKSSAMAAVREPEQLELA